MLQEHFHSDTRPERFVTERTQHSSCIFRSLEQSWAASLSGQLTIWRSAVKKCFKSVLHRSRKAIVGMKFEMPFVANGPSSEEYQTVIVKQGPSPPPQPEPVSRTYQYRKVMKPMLERKRRARINRCLDELKELMVTALQSEGENVSKLEKADILELTVRHLHKLRRQQRLCANPVIDSDRFRAGFTHAANEVSRCLASTPGVDITLGTKLMTHLGHRLNELDKIQPLSIHVSQQPYTPPSSPSTSICSSEAGPHYTMPLTPASSRSCRSPSPRSETLTTANTAGLLRVVPALQATAGGVWRPWWIQPTPKNPKPQWLRSSSKRAKSINSKRLIHRSLFFFYISCCLSP